jgi:hypothetical protein
VSVFGRRRETDRDAGRGHDESCVLCMRLYERNKKKEIQF